LIVAPFKRRPSRAEVARALREAEALWKPPPERDSARVAPGTGETNHIGLKLKPTPAAGKPQQVRK